MEEEKKVIIALTKEQLLLIPGALEFIYKLSDSKSIVDFILDREEKKNECDGQVVEENHLT